MPIEQCYGVIVVYKGKENLFLILQQDNLEGSWTFPKGHHEGVESPRETAMRELKEETAILEIELLDLPLIKEEYEVGALDKRNLKINEYFIGFVKDQAVLIQESEINTYKWVTYEEALKTIQYTERKEALRKAQEYLNMVK